jgi:prepilin peptidase CpaA
MSESSLLSIVPFLCMLIWAAMVDLRTRKIRNWLTFSMILTGLCRPLLVGGPLSTGQAAVGMLAGMALPLMLFALGALGGGDVKLLAGVGAWLGALAAVQVFCLAAIFGMIIVLAQAISQGRLRVLSRNSAVLALNMVHIGDVGIEHTTATGQSSRSVDKPLPYAVPVLMAVASILIFT